MTPEPIIGLVIGLLLINVVTILAYRKAKKEEAQARERSWELFNEQVAQWKAYKHDWEEAHK